MSSVEKLVIGAIATVLLLLLGGWAMIDIHKVEGNQVGVKETWSDGVIDEPFPSITYILWFTQEIYSYPISTQTYVMNDTPSNIENIAVGREKDAYQIQSVDPQDMKVSMNLMYHLDSSMIVSIHKEVRSDWEERIIRPRRHEHQYPDGYFCEFGGLRNGRNACSQGCPGRLNPLFPFRMEETAT